MNKPVSSSLKLSYSEVSDSLCDVGASSSANRICMGPVNRVAADAFFRGRCRCFNFDALYADEAVARLHVADGWSVSLLFVAGTIMSAFVESSLFASHCSV